MAARQRGRLGAADWRVRVRQQRDSGLSVTAFCAREQLSAASFYQWRARLHGTAGERVATVSEATEAGAFVDLGSVAMGAGRLELRLDLGCGVVLRLSRD